MSNDSFDGRHVGEFSSEGLAVGFIELWVSAFVGGKLEYVVIVIEGMRDESNVGW